jgi:hypothetical protein
MVIVSFILFWFGLTLYMLLDHTMVITVLFDHLELVMVIDCRIHIMCVQLLSIPVVTIYLQVCGFSTVLQEFLVILEYHCYKPIIHRIIFPKLSTHMVEQCIITHIL